jgi:tetratricopeptide (TPR) repeat protein
MKAFLRGDFGGAIEHFESQLAAPACVGKDRAVVYSNIAAAQFGECLSYFGCFRGCVWMVLVEMVLTLYMYVPALELHRKAIKSCTSAIECDKFCVSAHIIHGKSLLAQGKADQAAFVWRSALDSIMNAADDGEASTVSASSIMELKQLLISVASTSTVPAAPIQAPTPASSALQSPPPAASATSASHSRQESSSPTISGSCGQQVNSNDAAPPIECSINLEDADFIDGDQFIHASKSNDGEECTGKCAASCSTDENDAVDDATQSGLKQGQQSKSAKKRSKKKAACNSGATNACSGQTSPAPIGTNLNNRKIIERLHADCITDSSTAIIIRAANGNIARSCGDSLLDDLITYGYLQVNSGKLDVATKLFTELLSYRNDIGAVYLGLGSAQAMQRNYCEAITSFSRCIKTDPLNADAWKRRGQTKAANGNHLEGLEDLTHAISLEPDAETYNQRGLVYHKTSNFRRALADFRYVENQQLQHKVAKTGTIYNNIGMCEAQLGNIDAAISAYKIGITVDPNLVETYINLAQMYKEFGSWQESERIFLHVARSLDSNNSCPQCYTAYSLLLYALGRPRDALTESLKATRIVSKLNMAPTTNINNYLQSAACAQSLGRFKDAIAYWDQALALDAKHWCWFQREICICYWHLQDKKFDAFNLDNEIEPMLKYGWCKRLLKSQGFVMYSLVEGSKYECLSVPTAPDCGAALSTLISATECSSNSKFDQRLVRSKLLADTAPFECWVQQNCQGFLPNQRQRVMFQLAVQQMAQALRVHVESVKNSGPGLQVNDCASSLEAHSLGPKNRLMHNIGASGLTCSSSSSSSSTNKRGGAEPQHEFNWRDFFDVAVRWRQISEMNDPVWWIDRLPYGAFDEGFGLQTPIVNGQLKTIRYYSYYPRALQLVKHRLTKDKYYFNAASNKTTLTERQCAQIASAGSLEELYDSLREDFYVIHRCRSKSQPSLILEGTRLTLVRHDPDGYEFTIRTPGTPARWTHYAKDLQTCFQTVVDALASYSSQASSSVDPQQGQPQKWSDIKNVVLQLYYYWVTFAPLTRGTAVCGYMCILGALQSCGLTLSLANNVSSGGGRAGTDGGWPKDIQLDWEAIFADSCEEFVATASGWFDLAVSTVPFMTSFTAAELEATNSSTSQPSGVLAQQATESLNSSSDIMLVSVEEAVNSIREMIEIINMGSEMI